MVMLRCEFKVYSFMTGIYFIITFENLITEQNVEVVNIAKLVVEISYIPVIL